MASHFLGFCVFSSFSRLFRDLFHNVFSFFKLFQGLSLSLRFQDLKASRGLISPPPRLLSGSHSICY